MDGCAYFSGEIVENTLIALEEKYNCSFEAVSVGNRMNYSTSTLFIKDEENVFFSAVIDSKTYSVDDDYIRKKVGSKIRKEIISVLNEKNICADIDITFVCEFDTQGETDINIKVEDFFDKYKVISVGFDVCVKQVDGMEEVIRDLISVLRWYSSKSNMPIGVTVFVIPEKCFDTCVENMNINPKINHTWFDDYSPVSSVMFNVNKKKINPKEAQVLHQLVRGSDEYGIH